VVFDVLVEQPLLDVVVNVSVTSPVPVKWNVTFVAVGSPTRTAGPVTLQR